MNNIGLPVFQFTPVQSGLSHHGKAIGIVIKGVVAVIIDTIAVEACRVIDGDNRQVFVLAVASIDRFGIEITDLGAELPFGPLHPDVVQRPVGGHHYPDVMPQSLQFFR